MRPAWLKLSEIRSHWYENVLEEWHPDPKYVDYLKNQIEKGEYLAPIVVVRETSGFVVVNGHHRYYANLLMDKKRIKGFVLDGSFEDTDPLRKAEVLLKEYDQKTEYKYQFSGYLDRWAAAAERRDFINRYRPVRRIDVYHAIREVLKAIPRRLFPRDEVVGDQNGRYQENSGK